MGAVSKYVMPRSHARQSNFPRPPSWSGPVDCRRGIKPALAAADTSAGKIGAAVLCFGWNPLVLWETAGNGHNDSLMMMFALLAILCLLSEVWPLAFTFLACSVLVKYVSLVLLPVFIVWLLRRHGRTALRPLLAGESEPTSKLSREHVVANPVPGLVLVAGGKYTTYRLMARDAVDAVVHGLAWRTPPSCTDRVPLARAAGYLALWNARRRLATVILVGFAYVLKLAIANPIGSLRAVKQNSELDHALRPSREHLL